MSSLPGLSDQFQIDQGCKVLSQHLNPDYVYRFWFEGRNAWAMRYLEAWRSGVELRKPFQGFHPGIYRDNHPDLQSDPTIAFLNSGRPNGPWLSDVLVSTDFLARMHAHPRLDVALHLHLHYPEMADGLFDSLASSHFLPDIFISTTSIEGKVKVEKLLKKHRLSPLKVLVFPNRGRDLGPLLTGFREELLNYNIIGHFHTKGSKHAPNYFVKRWNNFLFQNLIGHRSLMLNAILESIATDSTIGIVYPDDPMVWGWFKNYSLGKALLQKIRLPVLDENKFFNFPTGSMFWARTEVLMPLFKLQLGWDDYPEEPLPQDGTILHCVERLLGIIPEQLGYRTILTHAPGLKR